MAPRFEMTWLVWVGLAGCALVVCFVLWEELDLPGSITWRARRADQRELDHWLHAPTAEILERCREIAKHSFPDLPTTARLQALTVTTDAELFALLEALCAESCAADEALQTNLHLTHNGARSLSMFDFMKTGFTNPYEALRRRLAA